MISMPVERPAVRLGAGLQLLLRLRERNVETLLAGAHALEQELQRERGLAGTRIAVDEIEPLGDQSAAQDFVQPPNPGRGASATPRGVIS